MREFHGDPVVRTWCFHCQDPSLTPHRGIKIPQAVLCGQKKKKKKGKLIHAYQLCCCCSVTKSCLTLYDPRTVACQAFLSFTISWSLLKLMFVESVMPSNHLILCHSLLLLPSIFPSIRVFSNVLAVCIK